MEEVFKKKDKKAKPGFNMAVVLGTKKANIVGGQVGLEIEMEGKNLLNQADTPPPWVYHKDNSLRGEENAEYVLHRPVLFDEVEGALNTLWDGLKKKKAKIDDSNRTSVHVHLNCQDFFLNRLTSLMALYIIFEEPLTEWCGEHRVGNLFALRSVDAPAIVSTLKKFIMYEGNYPISDAMHYAGMNAQALVKFGSLEFRTMRGCQNSEEALEWVSFLRRLYELSEAYPDPREIIGQFSAEGPISFFETMLADRAPVLRNGIGYTDDQIADAMFKGVRLAQDLCFCRDWSMYKSVKLKPDPFDRDSLKQARKVAAGLTPQQVEEAMYNIEQEYYDQQQGASPSPYHTLAQYIVQDAVQPVPDWNNPNI